MRILIFTSKDIGLSLTEYLLVHFPEDEYEIIVCGPGDAEISIKLAEKCDKVWCLSEKVLEAICEKEDSHFDWLINLWGGHIFERKLLLKARDTLNIHPSFLPFGRGSDPVVWALRYEFPAGATLHRITEKLDAGDVWCQEKVCVRFENKGHEIYDKVVRACKDLFFAHWKEIRNHKIEPKRLNYDGCVVWKRRELLENRRIFLQKNMPEYMFLRTVLAYDFEDKYSAEVVFEDKLYSISIVLKEKSLTRN